MSSKRKGISKGTRFRIFARDNFTCRYCGRQSDKVKLEVDHIIAVASGGGYDDSNLRTSCEDCNRGKSGKALRSFTPNESDRLRMAQERHEQEEAALSAVACAEARQQLKDSVVYYWCEATGRDEADRQTISVILSYVRELGHDLVFGWIDRAAADPFRRCSDSKMGKYISGIRRNHLNQKSEA